MKKGFTLALMLVALVAMVAPVSANAPTIIDLPDEIVVGNAEDQYDDAGTTLSLMRTNANALNINTTVGWNNPGFDYSMFHVYLHNAAITDATSQTTVAAYDTDGYTTPVGDTVLTALSDGAEADVSALNLHAGLQGSATVYTMSLIDVVLHAGLITAGVNPATATAQANGVVVPSTYSKTADVTFIAAVTSGTVGMKAATQAMSVLCQAGSDSAADLPTYVFANSDEGWIYVDKGNGTTLSTVPQLGPDASGIGFELTAPVSAQGYSQWKVQPEINVTPVGGGSVYKMVASMNTSDSSHVMGYRFTFNNVGYTHYGEVQVQNTGRDDFSNPNTPLSGSPFQVRMYWEPPVTLAAMGDGEFLDDNPYSATDGNFPSLVIDDLRDYSITFDAIPSGSDTGVVQISSLDIAGYTPPTVSATDVEVDYGSAISYSPTSASPLAFNTTGAWINDSAAGSNPFSKGTPQFNANTLVIGLGSQPTLANQWEAFTAATMNYSWYDQDLALQPVSNTLYRLVIELSVADQAECPVYRSGAYTVYADNDSFTNYLRKMTWQENWGGGWAGNGGKGVTGVPSGYPLVSPMAPSASASAPSVVASYVYTHNVPTATGNDRVILATQVSVVDTMLTKAIEDYAWVAWNYPDASITVYYVAWQNLGNGE
jgi:hypothetical protein